VTLRFSEPTSAFTGVPLKVRVVASNASQRRQRRPITAGGGVGQGVAGIDVGKGTRRNLEAERRIFKRGLIAESRGDGGHIVDVAHRQLEAAASRGTAAVSWP
jgi:hypothetical protein